MTTRIILRSLRNGQYVAATNAWTKHAERALNFEKAVRAEEFVAAQKLPDMELIVEYPNRAPLHFPLSRRSFVPPSK